MKDTTKGFWLGIICGVGLSLATGAALMMFVVTPKTAAAIAAATSAHQQTDAGGFTVLIEPAPAKSSAALQLFDLLRPGLGAMLAKFQSTQSSEVAPRWVVDGHVKPAAVAPGSSYCWLNASGEVESCQAVSQ